MKDKRLEILNVLKHNMVDGYELEDIDFLDELEIGLMELFEEIDDIYKASGGLMISKKEFEYIDKQRRKSVEFEVLKLLYRTAKQELTTIIIGRQQVIQSLTMMFIQSGLPEVEELYGFTSEEINELPTLTIYEIVKAGYEYLEEIRDDVEDINPLYDMADKINELLGQVL